MEHDDTPIAPSSAGLARIDLAQIGLNELAYVKSIRVNGVTAFGVFAANGQPLSVVTDKDAALNLIMQHDMHLVHLN